MNVKIDPFIEFAAENKNLVILIFLSILVIYVINIISIVITSKKDTKIPAVSILLVLSNLIIGVVSTFIWALCVLFLDTSRILYDNFNVFVSGPIQIIAVTIDVLSIVGILILIYLKIRR